MRAASVRTAPRKAVSRLAAASIPRTIAAPPCFPSRAQPGFSRPADDYLDGTLDLNTLLIRHPDASFHCRVNGDSMTGAGIFDGDYLIVDRALRPTHGDVVVVALDGELTCKILDLRQQRLLAANRGYPPIPFRESAGFIIEGVVTSSIRRHRCLP